MLAVRRQKENLIMKSKLIIVEGIPGSGKTTTAENIRNWVANKSLKPLLYLEDSPYHPVDLDNLSYFDEKQYKNFVEEFKDYRQYIEKISEKSSEGYYVYYRRWGEIFSKKMPEKFSEVLYSHDAHDTLPPEKYRELLVERWKNFSSHAKISEEMMIFECCFLQNPITVFIGKHNYEIEKVKSLIFELAEIVHDLNPVLFHLRGESARETVQRVIDKRPQAWIEFVEKYITGQGYGRANKLSGREGVFHFYEMMQEIEGEIILKLDWRKLTIDNTNWNWEQNNQEIKKFLVEIV